MDIGTLTGFSILGLSIQDAIIMWRPLIIFVIGVAIYSIFVFKFYRFLARKRIFELNLNDSEMHPTFKKFIHALQSVILFPVVVFFWFMVMTVLMTIITSDQTITNIMFISVAFVSAVRICAYYKEDLSRDLAKLIPFALLAIFLIDASYISLETSISMLKSIPSLWQTIVYYLVFIILLEAVMRVITAVIHKGPKRKEKEPEEIETPDPEE